MPNHPAGGFAFEHTNECTLRRHEDARAVSDADLARHFVAARRPMTQSERTLAAALNLDVTADTLVIVTWAGVVRRVLDPLPGTTPTPTAPPASPALAAATTQEPR